MDGSYGTVLYTAETQQIQRPISKFKRINALPSVTVKSFHHLHKQLSFGSWPFAAKVGSDPTLYFTLSKNIGQDSLTIKCLFMNKQMNYKH